MSIVRRGSVRGRAGRYARARGALVLLAGLSACGDDKPSDAEQAVEAAKALMQVADQAKQMNEAAEEARQAAKQAVPEGASDEQAKQLADNAGALAALRALGQGNGGAVTNWRQLQPFLPDSVGDYTAKGELEGRTNKAGPMTISSVSRNYEHEGERVSITISDTAMNPMLRAPFAMAAMVEEDSTAGYRKGAKIKGHTGIIEWNSKRKESKASLLVADRFLVHVQARGVAQDDAASGVLKGMDLDGLAKVKPEEDAEAAPEDG